jgi:hypothetical protein
MEGMINLFVVINLHNKDNNIVSTTLNYRGFSADCTVQVT